MTSNFWRMEVPLLGMDKTLRRDIIEDDTKRSRSYVKCTKGESEVGTSVHILGCWYVDSIGTVGLDEINWGAECK